MRIGKTGERGRQHNPQLAEMAEHHRRNKGNAGHGQCDDQGQLEVERPSDFNRLVGLDR
ncbi:hypothetical protein D3C85_1735230 [compost metagenome]